MLDFDGDIRASAVEHLREEISAVVQVARPEDEVLLRLESKGGMVHTYGLAASQLRRLKSAWIRLTASVDEVAASGGYMMACVAERIIAAPFAIIGSIGVVGQLPNFNRFLKEHNVDFELHTAGRYNAPSPCSARTPMPLATSFRRNWKTRTSCSRALARESSAA